jgi:plastocyanin
MRFSRAGRRLLPTALRPASLSVLFVLCALCGAFATGAIAAPGRDSHERSSRAARACHRNKRHQHHRCPALHARGKGHRKRKHGAASGTTHTAGGGSAGSGSGSSAPWTVVPPSVAPGSTPGTGGASPTPPGSGGAAPGRSPAPAGPPHVEVTAEDTAAFRFVLSRPAVPAGEVIVEFVNHGQDEHNLNAVEPAKKETASPPPENTSAGAHLVLALNLHAGSYNLFCSLADHRAKGMEATLKVE